MRGLISGFGGIIFELVYYIFLHISFTDLCLDIFLTSSRIFSSSPRMTRSMHSLCDTTFLFLLIFSSWGWHLLQLVVTAVAGRQHLGHFVSCLLADLVLVEASTVDEVATEPTIPDAQGLRLRAYGIGRDLNARAVGKLLLKVFKSVKL